MALLETAAQKDDDRHPAHAGDDPDNATETKGQAKKKHRDNMLIIGIAIVGVILTYLIYRSNKNAQAATTQTSGTTLPYGAVAGSAGTTNATDPFAEAGVQQLQQQQQQATSALAGLQTALQNLQGEVGQSQQASPPPSTPAAQAPPATPGYGYINLPGIGQSIILGQVGEGGVYNVGGGAPVYFGNANAVSQGPAQEQTGNYLYTPAQYAGLVSSTQGGPFYPHPIG